MTLLIMIYGVVTIVSVYGNALVLWVVSTTKSLQNVNNLLIANLAVSDIIIALFCIPFQFHAAFVQRWDLPQLMCKLCPFVQTVSVNVNIFTLILIARDRYKAIMAPLNNAQILSKKATLILLLLTWLLALILATPMGILYKFSYIRDRIHGIKPFCSPYESPYAMFRRKQQGDDYTSIYSLGDRFSMNIFDIYMLVTLVYQYLVPLGCMIFAYSRMSIKLWRNQTPGNGDDDRDQQLLVNKKKSIKMMVTVIVIFGVCWLPWHIFITLKLSWPAMAK